MISFSFFKTIMYIFFQFHVISSIKQGRQKESSVVTPRSPFSTEFFEALCVECVELNTRVLTWCNSKEMKILSGKQVGIEPTNVTLKLHHCACASNNSNILNGNQRFNMYVCQLSTCFLLTRFCSVVSTTAVDYNVIFIISGLYDHIVRNTI